MGGGSSVMGMVAYRGTPEAYAEWEAHGAQGWGWTDVLPFFRKLEQDLDFDGELHGKDGPVPIRRTPPQDWPPLSEAVHAYAQERHIPVHCRHERRLSLRLRRGAHEQLAGQTRLFGDLLSRCIGAGARHLTIINEAHATDLVFAGGRVAGVVARMHGERRNSVHAKSSCPPAASIRPRSCCAPASDQPRICARSASTCGQTCPALARTFPITPSCSWACCKIPAPGQAPSLRPHPMTAFGYSSGLPGAPRSDMYINVQCKTSWSPLGSRIANLAPSLLKPAARGRVTLPARHAEHPCVEFNFVGEEIDLRRLIAGFAVPSKFSRTRRYAPCAASPSR